MYDLSRALAMQRSAIARRSLARKLAADYGISGFQAVLDAIGTDSAAAAAFDGLTIPRNPEMPARKKRATQLRRDLDVSKSITRSVPELLPDELSATLTSELRVVAEIYGFMVMDVEPNMLADFIQPNARHRHERWSESELEHERRLRDYARKLRQCYDEGDEALLLRTLPRFTERQLRAAAATLSPFENGKAGTFDWLDRIADIDEMYLFFQKCIFYVGRGIPALRSSR
jgi:hypothetical protein